MSLPLDQSNAEVRNGRIVFPQDEDHLYPRYFKVGDTLWHWDIYRGPQKVKFVRINPDGWVRLWKIEDENYIADMPCLVFATRNELLDAKIRRLQQMKREKKDD